MACQWVFVLCLSFYCYRNLKNCYVVHKYSCIVAYMLEMFLKSMILAMGEGEY